MDEGHDLELVRRCQAGDERAFTELVERYTPLVFALVSRTIGDPGRTDDLAQEVFLRIHRGLPYFRGEARLSTWIYRIAANLCLQDRSRRRLATSSLDAVPGERPRFQPGESDRQFGDLELKERLEKALARLSPHARFIIAAHYLEGVRYEDLAAALGVPLGTLKTQLHRAKRELRHLLETEF